MNVKVKINELRNKTKKTTTKTRIKLLLKRKNLKSLQQKCLF